MSKNKKSITVPLSGLLTIRTIANAKAALIAALDTHDSVEIDIDPNSEIDVAGVQLVWAANVEARNASKHLSLRRPFSDGLRAVLDNGGFVEAMSAEERQFWLHSR